MPSHASAGDRDRAGESIDLQDLVAHLPIAVYVCEAPTGVILLYNRRAAEIWGREPTLGDTDERFCGSYRLFRLDGTALPHADTPMAHVLRDGGLRDEEVVIERPDGSRVTVRVNISPVCDQQGRIVGAVNAFQDITERHQAQEDAARLAAIVASADDAIVSKTLQGIVVSWNGGAEKMFGYSRAEMVGMPITTIIPAERQHEEAEILDRLKRGETIEHFETERLAKDGRTVSISLTVSPLRSADGRIIGASKIARDITEQKRAQEVLETHLRTLEALYRLADLVGRAEDVDDVCEAAIDAIMMVGRASRASVLVFDDASIMRFRAWHGLSDRYRAAVDGHSPWTPEDGDPAPILVEDALADPRLGALRDVIAAEGIRALGFVPLAYHGRLLGKFMIYYDSPHSFSADELRLAATIAHHVSFGLARAQSDAAMKEVLNREQAARRDADDARAEAEQANQAKDEFLAMLAHELRNPLGVIVNAFAVLEGGPDQHPERLERARRAVRRQTDHLSRLLDDLLDVARFTSGRIELAHDHVDLRAAIEQALDGQRHRIEAKRQQVKLSLGDEPAIVTGDAVRLQQVLGNLLNNASKYTPAGGSIWITVGRERQEVVLRIRDNGVGIPADKLESIFDLFMQANPSLARTEGGLGIGLTLVKRVVELHGGDVRARSEGAGRGAEFTVRLPLASPAPSPAAQPSTSVPVTPRRILVIEDNDDGREMLVTTLRFSGHQVEEAATGREGLEMATRHSPDVVLVDIGLPDVNGYEIGQQLRETFGSSVRLVAFTGYGQPQDRARSESAGFDAHLVKPIDPPKLAEVLHRLS